VKPSHVLAVADENASQIGVRPAREPSAKALLAKVFGGAVDIAFLGAPNDLAVAVTSAHKVPNGRAPNPTFREVACDHITFFSTDAGVSALADALL
jgi:hypothetical protein